jgi:hypothetical protein
VATTLTVSNSSGFEFPFGNYVVECTKIDPPEERDFNGKKSVRTTFYFKVVEVIDTDADKDEDVLDKELRSYVTIPSGHLGPRTKLRKYAEALLNQKFEEGEDITLEELFESLEGCKAIATWEEEYIELTGQSVQRITSLSPYRRRRRKQEEEEAPEPAPSRRAKKDDTGDDEEPF